MDLASDDEQTGAREEVDHVSRSSSGESEILRLDQHQCALWFFPRLIANYIFQHPSIRVRVTGPEPKLFFSLFSRGGCQHCRFEIPHLIILVDNQVAIRIADRFAAPPIGTNIP